MTINHCPTRGRTWPRNPAERALINQMQRLPGLNAAAEWIEANTIASAIRCFRAEMDALERRVQALDWQAIAHDALTRGNRPLADALLHHARHVEELEAIADAAASVYADGSDADAWTDLFEALSSADRLPGQADIET